MMQKEIDAVFERVRTWSPQRQRDAVDMLNAMEEDREGTYALTREQIAEVRHRLREKNPKTITLAQFNKNIRGRYGS
jgi:hypothetical protein